jgi:hypothetical protein
MLRAASSQRKPMLSKSASRERLRTHVNYKDKPHFIPDELLGAFNALSSCFWTPEAQQPVRSRAQAPSTETTVSDAARYVRC